MPVFHAHIPDLLTGAQKRALADALNRALHEALGTPPEDRFVVLSTHSKDELFIHPTFPDLSRSDRAMIVTVTLGAGRSIEQKRRLAALVTRYAVDMVGIGSDDICLMMYDVPLESMSFGAGALLADLDFAMPWVAGSGKAGPVAEQA